MTSGLKLSSNALVLYAILWHDSGQGTRTVQNGFAAYSRRMNVTIPTYYSTIRKLTEKGLVSEKSKGKLTVTDRLAKRSPFKSKI